jgi:hypothetical protein
MTFDCGEHAELAGVGVESARLCTESTPFFVLSIAGAGD